MNAITQATTCARPCHGDVGAFTGTRLIVLTGGPGAGKTAVLDVMRKELCRHVAILPEAASIIFGGGFWRLPTLNGRLAAQRAILHVQTELEALVAGEEKWPLALCDRGIIDGLAYWPLARESFWQIAGGDMEKAYARYHMVIHLRTPGEEHGYDNSNPLRTETADEARAIDERIALLWRDHPRYHVIESTPDFLQKAALALRYITDELPGCCRIVTA